MRMKSYFTRSYWNVSFTPLVLLWLTLMVLGWVMVTSASTSISEEYTGNVSYFSIRHFIYITLSILAFLIVSRMPVSWWQKTSEFWLLLALLGLVAVLIPGIGHTVNGSSRWLDFGIMKLQPSEFGKFAAVLYVAGYIVRRQDNVQQGWVGFLIPIAVTGTFVVLFLMEPDFGSVVVMMGAVLSLLFLGGVKAGQFFVLVTVTLLLGYFVVTAEEYRLQRLTTYLEPFHPDNVYGPTYQLAQSLIAFGRGGFFGVGFGESIQKLFYLPESHTDFVFAIWAEETGLFGVVIVLSLLIAFIYQCLI
jgi:cell division protein FtsW